MNEELQKETPDFQKIITDLNHELGQTESITFRQKNIILLSLTNILLNEPLDDETRAAFEGLFSYIESAEEVSLNCFCDRCKKSITG